MAQNDGLIDGPGHNTAEAQTMASCFHLLFNCLQTLFAWFVTNVTFFKYYQYFQSMPVSLTEKHDHFIHQA